MICTNARCSSTVTSVASIAIKVADEKDEMLSRSVAAINEAFVLNASQPIDIGQRVTPVLSAVRFRKFHRF